MSVAEQYIAAFSNLAKETNTVLLPANSGDVSSMVSQVHVQMALQLNGSVKEPNISIYFFFPPITQWCSISDVVFTGGRGVSDFSVLKYY